VLIAGAGSYSALLLAEFNELSAREPVKIASSDKYPRNVHLSNLRTCFLNADELSAFSTWRDKRFIVAIGNQFGRNRRLVYDRLCALGGEPVSLISETSIVKSPPASGSIILPGAYIGPFCTLGENIIINTKASIDHESVIGQDSHCMGGCVITGRVTVQDNCTIGSNATILPDLIIGHGSTIGAGAVVTKNIMPETINIGVPAFRARAWSEAIIDDNLNLLSHFG